MRKYLSYVILIIAAGAIAALIMHMHAKSKALEDEAHEFVTGAMNAFTENWETQKFIDVADPGLIKAMSSQGQSVYQLFNIYRNLGKRLEPSSCAIKDITTFNTADDDFTSASYTCETSFENSSSSTLITAKRGSKNPAWRIYYIKVSAPYFERNQ